MNGTEIIAKLRSSTVEEADEVFASAQAYASEHPELLTDEWFTVARGFMRWYSALKSTTAGVKYRADQPRDAQGQWMRVGVGSAAGHFNVQGPEFPDDPDSWSLADEVLKDGFGGALSAIDSVHKLPAGRYSCPVGWADSWDKVLMGKSTRAAYMRDVEDGRPLRLVFSFENESDKTMKADAVHEIGHYIDAELLGGGADFASLTAIKPPIEEQEGIGEPDKVTLLRPVMEAIGETEAVAKLRRTFVESARPPQGWASEREMNLREKDRNGAAYRLDPPELWARAYQQWVAERSGDGQMVELNRKLTGPVHLWFQWEPDDFQPVAEAIDRMMVGLGWMSEEETGWTTS